MQKRSQHDVKNVFLNLKIFLTALIAASYTTNSAYSYIINQCIYNGQYVMASNFISLLMRIDFAVQI